MMMNSNNTPVKYSYIHQKKKTISLRISEELYDEIKKYLDDFQYSIYYSNVSPRFNYRQIDSISSLVEIAIREHIESRRCNTKTR